MLGLLKACFSPSHYRPESFSFQKAASAGKKKNPPKSILRKVNESRPRYFRGRELDVALDPARRPLEREMENSAKGKRGIVSRELGRPEKEERGRAPKLFRGKSFFASPSGNQQEEGVRLQKRQFFLRFFYERTVEFVISLSAPTFTIMPQSIRSGGALGRKKKIFVRAKISLRLFRLLWTDTARGRRA